MPPNDVLIIRGRIWDPDYHVKYSRYRGLYYFKQIGALLYIIMDYEILIFVLSLNFNLKIPNKYVELILSEKTDVDIFIQEWYNNQ